jgi:hypothetical protein
MSDFFLIKSILCSAFVAMNYLYCCEDKSLTAEQVLKSSRKIDCYKKRKIVLRLGNCLLLL